MKYLVKPVVYLDDTDFDDSGNITSIPADKTVFIMIQALFCGHCTMAKPDFQKLANDLSPHIVFATIEGDSKLPQVNRLMKKLSTIYPDFRGFPSYLLYHKGNRYVYNGGRKFYDLKKYLLNVE